MHPLIAHALDVAAVAMVLAAVRPMGVLPSTLGFLVALHDIGKFSRPFQAKVAAHWPAVLGPWPGEVPGARHDELGFALLSGELAAALDLVLPRPPHGNWRAGHRMAMLRALAGHHGRPPSAEVRVGPTVFCAGCRGAAEAFIAELYDIFTPAALPRPADEREVTLLAWRLAGLTTLSDWIGSRQAWFPYASPDQIADPARYFREVAMPRAEAAVAAAGLRAAPSAPFTGLRGLFPRLAASSPLQAWAEATPLPGGPLLAVIEDMTGSGKTEAAMTLAHRLIADGRADGVFIALPTMATANAMFDRLADSYRRLFTPGASPSLALVHGRARLDPRFRDTIAPDPNAPVAGRSSADPADEPAEAQCAAWLAEDRRRALLAQVGVGTIDQALLAILPVRHAALRQQGLAGKVLVIDEAHAFDPYMQHEMLALLRFHAALGGSALLLSATLPHALRQRLADAFREGLRRPAVVVREQGYPLATLVSGDGVAETCCAVRAGLARRVTATRLDDAEAAIARILPAARAGAAVAWVRNTVDDAIAAAAALRAHGVQPLLFHARFALCDRLAIEAEVLRRFGRDSRPEDRRCVLVATQVIEQSLDLDFDLLCTDLAPADLLLQRAGRLWRHAGREPRPLAAPELLVVSPPPVDEPQADWIKSAQPGTAAVYRDPALLWRSARAVFEAGEIATPGMMRPLIERAADRDSPDAVPETLAAAADHADGARLSQIGMAAQNVLDVWKGYDRDAGLWEPDLATPTRLQDRKQVTLRLARVEGGTVVPYAADPDPRRAWALSEVTIAAHRIAASPPPPGLAAAMAAARAGWGRWEREADTVLCAVLAEDFGIFELVAKNENGDTVVAIYDVARGLHFRDAAMAYGGDRNDPATP